MHTQWLEESEIGNKIFTQLKLKKLKKFTRQTEKKMDVLFSWIYIVFIQGYLILK